jgi:hypothetical protein
MVLVHVGSVVMLTTSKTSTTGMLAVLAYTTVTGRDMTAAVKIVSFSMFVFEWITYCLRVFDKWVGIVVRFECRGWSSEVALASADLKFQK